jgi:hypothetical protein
MEISPRGRVRVQLSGVEFVRRLRWWLPERLCAPLAARSWKFGSTRRCDPVQFFFMGLVSRGES